MARRHAGIYFRSVVYRYRQPLEVTTKNGSHPMWFSSTIGSPAIDNGHNILLPDDDLDWDRDGKRLRFSFDVLGLHRFQGESIDIGAMSTQMKMLISQLSQYLLGQVMWKEEEFSTESRCSKY